MKVVKELLNMDINVLVKEILKDWKWQVKEMSDKELIDDRSEWMKVFGRDPDDTFDMTKDGDIHTLSIELEQLRRFGEIIYDTERNYYNEKDRKKE